MTASVKVKSAGIWGEGRVGLGATFSFTLHEPAGTPPDSSSDTST